jgi:hypothetical protein
MGILRPNLIFNLYLAESVKCFDYLYFKPTKVSKIRNCLNIWIFDPWIMGLISKGNKYSNYFCNLKGVDGGIWTADLLALDARRSLDPSIEIYEGFFSISWHSWMTSNSIPLSTQIIEIKIWWSLQNNSSEIYYPGCAVISINHFETSTF